MVTASPDPPDPAPRDLWRDDLEATTIACSDYLAHQSLHRQVDGVWSCDACETTA